MSSRHRHDNKQALREQAMRERAIQAQQAAQDGADGPTSAQAALFQQPVKIQSHGKDATTELAKKVLGDYDKVGPYVFGTTGSVLGVGAMPGTPQPNKLQSKTGFPFNKPSTSTHQISHRPSFNGADKLGHKHDKLSLSKASTPSNTKSGESGAESSNNSASHHSRNSDNRTAGIHHGKRPPSRTEGKSNKHSSEREDNHVPDRRSERPRVPLNSQHESRSGVKSQKVDNSQHGGGGSSTIASSKPGHGSSSSRHHSSSRKSPSPASRESQNHRDRETYRSHDGKSRSRSSSQDPSDRRHSHSRHSSRSLSPVKPALSMKDGAVDANSKDSNSEARSNVTLVGPSVAKSPIKGERALDEQMAPPNGTIPINGLLKKPRNLNLPKISIPQEGKTSTEPFSSVLDIIKEMTLIDPPLTGISTPHKERTVAFFPAGHVDATLISQLYTPQPMDKPTHKRGSDKPDDTIHEDLAVSDSDSDGEDWSKPKPDTTQSHPGDTDKRTPEPPLRMLSSSESESEGEGEEAAASGSSSDSGSDSESSNSDGEGEAPADDVDKEELALEEKAKALAEQNPTPISPLVSPEPVTEQSQSSSTQSWSLCRFLPPKTSPTSIIGGDMGLCDAFKDTKDNSLLDRSDNLVKNSSKLKSDQLTGIDSSSDEESDFNDRINRTKAAKQNHVGTTNRKSHKKSFSNTEQTTDNAHKKSRVTKSPGHWPSSAKSPSAISRDQGGKSSSKSSSKSPAAKKSSRKNNTALDKGQDTSKSDKHRTSKSKEYIKPVTSPVEKLSNKFSQAPGKPSVVAKTEGKSVGRGRPSIKPKSPKLILSSESSESEEEMDVDVVTISPNKPVTTTTSNSLKTLGVEKSEVCSKLDFSTPPRCSEQEAKVNGSKSTSSPPSLSLSLSLPSNGISSKKKDSSDKKDKKERVKHDKRSEDKRKGGGIVSPVLDKKNLNSNSSCEKVVPSGVCKLDSVISEKEFRILSPISSFSSSCKMNIPGVTYSDGKPSIVVRLNFSLLDRIPSKDTDLTSPESGISSLSSSTAYTAPLSNPVSMDTTVGRDDDTASDLLSLDNMQDSAMEDDLPITTCITTTTTTKVHQNVKTEPLCTLSDVKTKGVSKMDDTKADVVAKAEILKADVKHVKKDSENTKSRTPSASASVSEVCNTTNNSTSRNPNSALSPGNKTSSGGTPSSGKVTSNNNNNKQSSVTSEYIIAQICGDNNKSAPQKRKRKYPKEGSDTKQHKPSSKSAKRHEPSSASDRPIKEEKESVLKSPQKTSERRSSAGSNSSRQSHKDKPKRRKCDDTRSEVKTDTDNIVKKESVSTLRRENDKTENHRMTNNSQSSNHISAGTSDHELKPQPDIKLQSADEYIQEAKRLKHEADNLGDKKRSQSLIYTEAVLSFILSGYAMEQERICDSNSYFKMYADTLNLLKYFHSNRFRNNHHDQDLSNTDKKISVLSLRIQALLCLKLFKLKKAETLKLKKVIDDHNKSSSKSAAPAPSPHQTNWNSRGTGTPSPMSPTPSPAGSIGSVGSQSSSCDVNPSKLTNGNLGCSGAMTSPGMVTVSQRIHSITSQYVSHTGYLVHCHDFWDQADAAMVDGGDFFQKLDCEVGRLTLHSSIWDLVRYIRQGLLLLKDNT